MLCFTVGPLGLKKRKKVGKATSLATNVPFWDLESQWLETVRGIRCYTTCAEASAFEEDGEAGS